MKITIEGELDGNDPEIWPMILKKIAESIKKMGRVDEVVDVELNLKGTI